MKTTEWHFNSQTLKVLLIDVFSPPFPSQTHDHSVCIRPPLLPFNVTSQDATFQLKGSFVRSFELFIMLLKVVFFSFKVNLFFSGLHQGTPSVAVAVQLQNPETFLLWETDPAEGKTGSSTTQHNRFYRTRRHHATVLTVVIFDMFLLIAACKWIVHLTPSWRRGLHADHSNNGTEGKLPWPASLCTLP